MKESTKNNRLKKEERRNAKATKKAKNTKVEKKSNPNNFLIFLLILLVVGGVFGGMLGYKWYQKDASIETYLEKDENAQYKEIQADEYTTMSVTAKKNDMNFTIDVDTSSLKKDEAKSTKEYWNNEDTQDYIKYLASYYLIDMKPNTRAIKASIKYDIKIDGKSIKSEKLTYREAKKFIEKQAEEESTEPVQEETKEIELNTDDVQLDSDNTIEVTPDGDDSE